MILQARFWFGVFVWKWKLMIRLRLRRQRTSLYNSSFANGN